MGYKLAGYDCLGGCELDPNVAETYKRNLNPKIFFNMDIRDFNRMDNSQLPEELFNLDILDGSPPCTTFSMAGLREKTWGKEKHFREGQKKQRLDDLVFVYCDTIDKLKPKVCILENVEGIIKGSAISYAREIVQRLTNSGYKVQVFNLQAAVMGVPSKRKRVFFIGLRKEFNLPPLRMQFSEEPILFKDIKDNLGRPIGKETQTYWLWLRRKPSDKNLGDIYQRELGKDARFNALLNRDGFTMNTIAANGDLIHWSEPVYASDTEIIKALSFPQDYQCANPRFYVGMSVPPVMMAQIATKINEQWLSKM